MGPPRGSFQTTTPTTVGLRAVMSSSACWPGKTGSHTRGQAVVQHRTYMTVLPPRVVPRHLHEEELQVMPKACLARHPLRRGTGASICDLMRMVVHLRDASPGRPGLLSGAQYRGTREVEMANEIVLACAIAMLHLSICLRNCARSFIVCPMT